MIYHYRIVRKEKLPVEYTILFVEGWPLLSQRSPTVDTFYVISGNFSLHSCYILYFLILYFICNFFIGIQFVNIYHNTQCSSCQVTPSVPITHSPQPPARFPLHYTLVISQGEVSLMFCHSHWYFHSISLFPFIPFH